VVGSLKKRETKEENRTDLKHHLIYTAIANDLDESKSVYFRNTYRYKHKTIENSEGTYYVIVGNTDYNISAARGAEITIKENGFSNAKSMRRDLRNCPIFPDLKTLHHTTSAYGVM
jgi:hypothetical protein